mgnify:CR=1 FL=1
MKFGTLRAVRTVCAAPLARSWYPDEAACSLPRSGVLAKSIWVLASEVVVV